MQLPHDPRALAAVLPDVPRYVETRSLLLSGTGQLRIGRDGGGGVATDTEFPSGAVVGRADAALLRDVLADVPDDFELIVQMDALRGAREALPGWSVAGVVVHSPARPFESPSGSDEPPAPGVVVSVPPEERWLEGLPDDVRLYAADAEAIAVRVVGGTAVAVCAAGDVTETLWDVGVDTLEGHRRRGHAAACFRALAAVMAARGLQPVWSAYEDYPPSLALAAKLGFRPVDRVAVLSPGASRPA